MILNTKKETICVNKIIGQKVENVVVEGDIIVPDIKPDILSTISNNGNVCVYKKEVMNGEVKIDGGINIYVMYLSDDQNNTIRSLNTVLDFTKTIAFDDCKANMNIDDNINIKSIECKILNGRKISMKVILDVSIKIYSNETIDIVNEIENIPNVEKLEEILELNSLVGTGETRVLAKDTIMIDSIDNLAEILKTNISIGNIETKISYNKVLAKSEANIKLLYLTDDNRINVVTNNIPIMGFIDMQNVNDSNICNTKYKLKNLIVKPNSVDEHSIFVEIELELSCFVYEKKTVRLIQDLYCPEEILNFTNKTIETRSYVNTIRDVINLSEMADLEGLNEGKVYDVDISPLIESTKVKNGKINYSGEIVISYTYARSETIGIGTREIRAPFEHTIDLNNSEISVVETNVEVQDDATIVNPNNKVETRLNLAFNVETYKNEKMNVIDEITLDENKKANQYSVVIYFVKPNDTLWNIAKELSSTVDDIIRLNGIENPDKINIGMPLFVPRYVKRMVTA
ncbi:MAG: DUF3794 domain-containing protein [Oscillospiraceae bacterium]|nr:DUF3794 domain-containing protein [Oscillospiraceae bacterium]